MSESLRLELLTLLNDHEWSGKQGFKVYCPTCGAEYRETTHIKKHRPACAFNQTYKALQNGSIILTKAV